MEAIRRQSTSCRTSFDFYRCEPCHICMIWTWYRQAMFLRQSKLLVLLLCGMLLYSEGAFITMTPLEWLAVLIHEVIHNLTVGKMQSLPIYGSIETYPLPAFYFLCKY